MTFELPASAATGRSYYDLDTLLPVVVRRIYSGDFASQSEMAKAYGINKATTTHWKQRAIAMGLTDARAWHRGFLLGRVAQEMAA